MKTAFQTLHHVNTINSSQCLTYMDSVTIFCLIFRLQELHGTVTRVMQVRVKLIVRQHIKRVKKTIARSSVHFIFQRNRRLRLGESNALRFQIVLIILVVLNIMPRTAHCYLVNHTFAYIFINLVNISSDITRLSLLHQLFICLYILSKEPLQVRNAVNRAILTVLK